MSFTVTEVNDAPTANDNALTAIDEDSGTRTIPFTTMLANDSTGQANESGQSLTITAVGNAVGGTVEIVGSDVLFHSTADFSGAASFEYTVQDNGTTNGANDFLTDVGAASFTIDPAAEIPSATNSTTAEDTQSTSGLVLTPNAADGGTVTHFKITGIAGGTIYQNNGTTLIANGDFITVADGGAGLKFTPTSNLNSPAGDTFRFDAQAGLDGAGTGLSLGRSVTITVTEVNNAPTASDDSLSSMAEDSGDRTIPFASLPATTARGRRTKTANYSPSRAYPTRSAAQSRSSART